MQLLCYSAGPGRRGCLGGAQVEGEGDQALLGAVVQVAFDAAAGGIGGGHDPRPGGGQGGLGFGVGDRGGGQFGEPGQPRPSVPARSASRVEATNMTPHSRPPTLTGTPTPARRPCSRESSAAGPKAPA